MRHPVADLFQILASALSVYLLRRTYSVAATAYASVVILQLVKKPEPVAFSVCSASLVMVDVLLKIVCSLFACSMLVLFNHEVVVL